MKDRIFRHYCNKDYSYNNMINVLIEHCPEVTAYIINNKEVAKYPHNHLEYYRVWAYVVSILHCELPYMIRKAYFRPNHNECMDKFANMLIQKVLEVYND